MPDRIPQSCLVSAFPFNSGHGAQVQLLWQSGLFNEHLLFKKRSSDSEAGYTAVAKGRILPAQLAAFLSLYGPSPYSRALEKFRFVHHDTPYSFHLVKYSKRATGMVHDMLHIGTTRLSEASLGLRFFLSRTLRYASQLLGVVVPTRVTETRLKKVMPDLRTTIINHWTSPEFQPRDRAGARRQLGLPLDKKLLLNVSSDMSRKNIDILPRILERLPSDYAVIRIGPSSRIASQFGPGRLFWKDYVPSDAHPLYFNAADALLVPSTDEGFGIPIVEAINSNLLTVASDISVFREILGENYPLLAPWDDADRWVEAIRDAVDRNRASSEPLAEYRSLYGKFTQQRGWAEYGAFFRSVGAFD